MYLLTDCWVMYICRAVSVKFSVRARLRKQRMDVSLIMVASGMRFFHYTLSQPKLQSVTTENGAGAEK